MSAPRYPFVVGGLKEYAPSVPQRSTEAGVDLSMKEGRLIRLDFHYKGRHEMEVASGALHATEARELGQRLIDMANAAEPDPVVHEYRELQGVGGTYVIRAAVGTSGFTVERTHPPAPPAPLDASFALVAPDPADFQMDALHVSMLGEEYYWDDGYPLTCSSGRRYWDFERDRWTAGPQGATTTDLALMSIQSYTGLIEGPAKKAQDYLATKLLGK